MKRRSVWSRMAVVAFAAVLAASLVACGGAKSTTSGGSAGDTYKIGAILSLTGTYAALGASEKNALELEVKRINDAGGVNGKQIELIIEDDGTDEAKAVAAASKLIEQDNVIAILGATGTGQTMAIRSEIDRAGIPQISMAGGTAVTSTFDPLVFQTPWSNTLVVPFVLKRVSPRRAPEDRPAHRHRRLRQGRPSVIVVGGARRRAPDRERPDLQPRRHRHDGAAHQDQGVRCRRGPAVDRGQGRRLDREDGRRPRSQAAAVRRFGPGEAEFVEGAGPAADGFIFGTGKSLVPANWGEGTEEYTVVNGFAERYKAAYGQTPDIFAGHAFDALTILDDALKRSNGDSSPEALVAAIEKTKDLIGFGGTFTFSATDHNGLGTDDLSLYKVTSGAWEPTE